MRCDVRSGEGEGDQGNCSTAPNCSTTPTSSTVPNSSTAPNCSTAPNSSTTPTSSTVPNSSTAPNCSTTPTSRTVPNSSTVPNCSTTPTSSTVLSSSTAPNCSTTPNCSTLRSTPSLHLIRQPPCSPSPGPHPLHRPACMLLLHPVRYPDLNTGPHPPLTLGLISPSPWASSPPHPEPHPLGLLPCTHRPPSEPGAG